MKIKNKLNLIVPILSPLLAIFCALVVGGFLMLFAQANPINAYTILFRESLADYFGFGNLLTKTAPLLLASLGVFVPLKAGLFNIGAEGQIYLGGLGSALIGLSLPGIPSFIHIPLALLGGLILGGIWGLIPGYLKAKRGVNEVITTLLLNYVAINFVGYLVNNPLKEPNAPSAFSPLIAESARLPAILPPTQAHAGILIGLVATGILWLMLARSPLGYQIEAVGLNPTAATYAGMSVSRTILLVMGLAGGLAGLAGAGEVMGLKYRLFDRFSPGYGFDAIAIALLSRGNLFGVVLTSFFFGILRSGANVMQRSANVPFTIVYAIQGLTVLFIAISFAIERYYKLKATH